MYNVNLAETMNYALMCAKKIRGFLYNLSGILCFANLKVKVTKYRMLSDRFEFSTHKLCKNKCVKNYTQKFREKNLVSDFSPSISYTYFHVRLQYFFIKTHL